MSTQEQPGGGADRVVPIDLGPGVSARDYAIEILRQQLETWSAHEAGARAGDDPRHVHAMRVAAQRARSALRTFADLLPDEAQALRERLGTLRRALGDARDLDVQIRRLRRARSLAITGPAAIRELELRLETRRRSEQPRVEATLDDARAAALDASLARIAELVRDEPPSPPIERVAAKKMKRLRRRARRELARLARLDADRSADPRHALRRRCRELRYMTEFVTPLCPAEANAFRRRVVRLQDRLGEAQDAEVTRGTIERVLLEDGARLGGPAIFEAGRLHERMTHAAAADAAALVRLARKTLEGRAWRALVDAIESAG